MTGAITVGTVFVDYAIFQDRLSALEQAWREQGAPISRHLAPGASPSQLDETERRLGHPIPPEVRALWSWHDGVAQPDEHVSWVRTIGPGSWEFLSSAEAVDHRDRRRSQWNGDPDAGDDTNWEGQWRSAWLPLFQMDAYALFVDCRQVVPTGTAPIRYYAHAPEDVFTPLAGSLRQILDVWVFVLEQRYRYWDEGLGSWEASLDAAMPLIIRQLA